MVLVKSAKLLYMPGYCCCWTLENNKVIKYVSLFFICFHQKIHKNEPSKPVIVSPVHCPERARGFSGFYVTFQLLCLYFKWEHKCNKYFILLSLRNLMFFFMMRSRFQTGWKFIQVKNKTLQEKITFSSVFYAKHKHSHLSHKQNIRILKNCY